MRLLVLGDVVGRPGRQVACRLASALKHERLVDFAIVNGENAAGGSGLAPSVLKALLEAGVDVVTSGDHIFRNAEVMAIIDEPRLLRPLNLSAAARGRGLGVYETSGGAHVAVLNVLGRVYLKPSANPFVELERALESIDPQVKVKMLDVHAEATSEKIALGWFLDGRVSLVFGTHTHVQTADERVLPNGTGYITDVGMCGPFDGVIGRRKDRVISHMLTDMPARFDVADGDVRAAGILADIDAGSGRCRRLQRFCWQEGQPLPQLPEEQPAEPSESK